jgi:hypothetical protein
LNVTNANFGAIWATLGLTHDWAGELDGRALAARVRAVRPEAIVRKRPRDVATDGGRTVNRGIRQVQAERYLEMLAVIAAEAERREERVVWG